MNKHSIDYLVLLVKEYIDFVCTQHEGYNVQLLSFLRLEFVDLPS